MYTDDRSGELRLRKRVSRGGREIRCGQRDKQGSGSIYK